MNLKKSISLPVKLEERIVAHWNAPSWSFRSLGANTSGIFIGHAELFLHVSGFPWSPNTKSQSHL